MNGRYDLKRSAVALLAAAVAGVGVYSANAEHNALNWQLTTQVLGGEAILALALALLPTGRVWPRWQRTFATGFAAVSLVLAFPLALFNMVRAGCACTDGWVSPPPLLGVSHGTWVWIALASVPLLLVLLLSLPPRVERPREHGAAVGD